MKLLSFSDGGPVRLGALLGLHVIDLRRAHGLLKQRDKQLDRALLPSKMLRFLDKGKSALDLAREILLHTSDLFSDLSKHEGVACPSDSIRIVAPIPRPRKNIVCLGLNYSDHANETGQSLPSHPIFFTKAPTSVIGPEEPIICHTCTKHIDYEIELAFVFGKKGKNIRREKAYDYIAGYTILNDISARDLQRRHSQWFKGKSLDTFAPMGPFLVTSDEIPDPHQLHMELRVNGEIRQRSNTANMVFTIPEIVEAISEGLTVEPGDIVATGTPAGVGFVRKPPALLHPHDVVEADVEGIGVLRNPVTADAD